MNARRTPARAAENTRTPSSAHPTSTRRTALPAQTPYSNDAVNSPPRWARCGTYYAARVRSRRHASQIDHGRSRPGQQTVKYLGCTCAARLRNAAAPWYMRDRGEADAAMAALWTRMARRAGSGLGSVSENAFSHRSRRCERGSPRLDSTATRREGFSQQTRDQRPERILSALTPYHRRKQPLQGPGPVPVEPAGEMDVQVSQSMLRGRGLDSGEHFEQIGKENRVVPARLGVQEEIRQTVARSEEDEVVRGGRCECDALLIRWAVPVCVWHRIIVPTISATLAPQRRLASEAHVSTRVLCLRCGSSILLSTTGRCRRSTNAHARDPRRNNFQHPSRHPWAGPRASVPVACCDREARAPMHVPGRAMHLAGTNNHQG
ncbi:hypothetical protein PSPO01_13399 [Paraphaeosphaeria sporulosa]